jgi:YVTN family beta-propeller protein
MKRRIAGLLSIAAVGVAGLLGCAPPTAYIPNFASNNVSVIATAINTVIATIPVGPFGVNFPFGVAVSPDGRTVYVVSQSLPAGPGTVSVIATASNMVTATIPVGIGPNGVAVTPDGSKVYVVNSNSNNVSVIATASNTVTATIPVGTFPFGVAVSPDGHKVYVVNSNSNNVSVIATASDTVIGSPIVVGNSPSAFGVFITDP